MPKDFLRQGLSAAQAAKRLALDGPNEMPSADNRNFLRILVDIFKQPMIFLLLAAGTVYFILGSRAEAILMIGSIFFVFIIEIVQENKTEKTLQALKNLSSPRALVISCLLYTSPSPRDRTRSRMPSSA